jgi:hypothetical protein
MVSKDRVQTLSSRDAAKDLSELAADVFSAERSFAMAQDDKGER